MPQAEEIEEPSNTADSSLIKDKLSVHNLQESLNKRNKCSIKFFKTATYQHPFYT